MPRLQSPTKMAIVSKVAVFLVCSPVGTRSQEKRQTCLPKQHVPDTAGWRFGGATGDELQPNDVPQQDPTADRLLQILRGKYISL